MAAMQTFHRCLACGICLILLVTSTDKQGRSYHDEEAKGAVRFLFGRLAWNSGKVFLEGVASEGFYERLHHGQIS